MANSLEAWISNQLRWHDAANTTGGAAGLVERTLRWEISPLIVRHKGVADAVISAANDVESLLDLTDMLLAHTAAESAAESLEQILSQAGSAWQVGERAGRRGLIRRVPEGVQAAADAAFALGSAGQLLTEAWAELYGRNPNPDQGYALAVKTVEAAASPVVSPNDKVATLGKMIGQMKGQKDWGLPLYDKDPGASSAALIGLHELIWHGQHNRHGRADGNLPMTDAEAQAAIGAAVTLVHWYGSGLVQRRSSALTPPPVLPADEHPVDN